MRIINEIIVHCSDTKPSMNIGVAKIREWHKARGWKDVGYNYVICRDGAIEGGRDLDGDGDYEEEIGSHALGHNANSIGICLVGGMGEDGRPDANFTFHQYIALSSLLKSLLERYKGAEVLGHRDIPGVSKACPCFDVKSFIGEVN